MASVSLNALPSGTVEQVVHYYPFGGQFADGTSSSLQEFKFTGKEWDSSKGQNLYDFGARTYDPALLRWTTPDPLSSKYPAWSPYAYCGNSPVLFVDPDGKDIWGLRYDGTIMYLEKSDRNELYVIDLQNQITDRFLKLENDDVLRNYSKYTRDNGKKNPAHVSSKNKQDMMSLFVFISDNSQYEWALHSDGDNYVLGTVFETDKAGNWDSYGLSERPKVSYHSHPNVGTSKKEEVESFSIDWKIINNEPYLKAPLYYIYFPMTSNVYQLIPQKGYKQLGQYLKRYKQ